MAEPTRDVIDDTAPVVSPDAVEIRGRSGVHAVVALAAGTIAVAFAWRIGDGASAAWWALVAVLAVVTAVNLVAWFEARTPQLVADEHGVRVRTGRTWLGLPWDGIESLRIERPAGAVGDSVLVLAPVGADEVHVAHGASARVSSPDLLASLDELRREHERRAGGGTVVTRDEAAPMAAEPAAPATAEPAERPAPASEPAPGRDPVPQPAPQRSRPLSAVASARRAVRAQVHRSGPATVGSSALKHEPSLLPEVNELRRTEGRVGLVIETVSAPGTEALAAPVDAQPVPATAVGAAPVEAYPTRPAPEPVIGPQITVARTQLRISVDELAERTRIRPHVIESIEVDDFVPCGGDFYARGHLRSLCRTLGVDAAPLLEVYDREYAHAPVAARRVFEAELATGPQAAIRSVSGGPRWSVLLGVVMVLAIVWGGAKIVADRTAGPEPTTDLPVVTVPDPTRGGDPTGLSALGAPQPNSLRLATDRRTSVVVRDARGDLVWRGTLRPGQPQRLEVAGPATVRADRAASVRLRVNGTARGTVGDGAGPDRRTVGRSAR